MLKPIVAAVALLASAPVCAGAPVVDLTGTPLEQLLNIEVSTASKFPQKASMAPSAVTVITAADIQHYGHRTLSDILASIRGLYVNYDRNYSYLGVRGFGRPGDYNTRIQLLIDGVRFNDGIYDQAAIGTDFPVDIDLIERVEFVPGPGSALYGNNAFFGVINVITKRGHDLDGAELSGEIASAGTHKGRITYGKRLENGADMLLSASGYDSDGRDIDFPEFGGTARNLDRDRYQHLFAKLEMENFSLGVTHSERKKAIPTASYGQVFNDPRPYTLDEYTLLNLKYASPLSATLEVSGSAFYGRYDYTGDYIMDYPPVTPNRDEANSRWWGGELHFLSTAWRGHKLLFGAEYRNDTRTDQFNFDLDPAFSYLEDRRSKKGYGLFVQDEWILNDRLTLNLGIRQDTSRSPGSSAVSSTNPRLALIYAATPETTLKFLYGTAFRSANAYEKYYVSDPAAYKASPDLQPEKIRTVEVVAEHYWHENFRTTASLYQYHIDDLISYDLDPADGKLHFVNLTEAKAHGLEVEAEMLQDNGARWRASLALQNAKDGGTGERLGNSPRQLAKLNYAIPLVHEAWLAGVELHYTGNRKTLQDQDSGSNLTANLTLQGKQLARNLDVSFSVYNLFDRRNLEPASTEHFDSRGLTLDTLARDGRSFRAKLTYRF